MMNLSKICTKCKIEKSQADFYKDKSKIDGIYTSCKICSNKKDVSSRKKHHESILERDRRYHHNNKEKRNLSRRELYNKTYKKIGRPRKFKTNKEYCADWYLKNKEKVIKSIVARTKERRATDINFKLALNLRGRLNKAIKHSYKKGSAVKDLGCSISEFKIHLEKQFKPGMTWDNYGKKGWTIDHIVALSKFDLTNYEDVKRACHYTNMQPLWFSENSSKGCR